jgi:Protein of unknown function (DUF664)
MRPPPGQPDQPSSDTAAHYPDGAPAKAGRRRYLPRTPVLPSGWTALGLVKHLGFAERHWFQRVATGTVSELSWAEMPGEEEGRKPFTTGLPAEVEPIAEGTLVTSYYDWSATEQSWKDAAIFPVIPERALRATLGIMARTVAPGKPRPASTTP